MCYSPIKIKNVLYKTYIGNGHYLNNDIYSNTIKDNQSRYMYVPCGVCKQCVAIEQMELIERIQMEAMYNHIFMGTLTYKNETLPRIELEPYEDKNGRLQTGYNYRYAKYEDARDCIKRLREKNSYGHNFKYLIVSERGSKRARPHFHILLLFKKTDIGDFYDCLNFEKKHKWTLFNEWKRNIGTKDYPIYQELCTYVESWRGNKKRSTYDFHYVNPALTKGGVTDAAFYVLKYMLKGIQEKNAKRAIFLNYDYSTATEYWNRIKNRKEYSLGFGLDIDWSKAGKDRTIKEEICNQEIIKYLKDGVKRSLENKEDYAYYYCPESINTFPLANYYKRFKFIYDEDYQFYLNNPNRYRDKLMKPERMAYNQIEKQISDFERIIQQTSWEDLADDFDQLLNF